MKTPSPFFGCFSFLSPSITHTGNPSHQSNKICPSRSVSFMNASFLARLNEPSHTFFPKVVNPPPPPTVLICRKKPPPGTSNGGPPPPLFPGRNVPQRCTHYLFSVIGPGPKNSHQKRSPQCKEENFSFFYDPLPMLGGRAVSFPT